MKRDVVIWLGIVGGVAWLTMQAADLVFGDRVNIVAALSDQAAANRTNIEHLMKGTCP